MRFKAIILFLALVALASYSLDTSAQRRRNARVAPRNAETVAQTSDFLSLDSLVSDSLMIDSLALDSIATNSLATDSVPKRQEIITAPVDFEATDSIVFTQNGFAHLYGEGQVSYEQIKLTADVITMNIDSTTVFAYGREDSLGTVKGKPVFTEGETPYETNQIRYNFNSKKGIISNIVTQQGEGYVIGNNAKKGANDEIYLKQGIYTTCDNHDHPHFYMQMTYAKVRPKKNVVTGPAYLVVEDVPLPIAVPFFFFPFNSTYSSGILMPTYMDDSNRGFGLTNGGYYFAISDKMDLALRGDIFTKGSWRIDATTNYVKRYRYSGNFQANYQVTKMGDKGLPDYSESKDFKIVWSHRQDSKANPNTTFTASVNFSTSSYEKTNIGNLYNAQAMAQNTKTSSVSYSRNFPDQKLNISLSANIAQTTRDSSISITLPDLNISLSTIFPFKRKHPVGSERWYEKISMRYSGRFSASINTKDDLIFKKNYIKDWRNGMKHEIPVSATFTLFKYFNVTPNFSYTERWYTQKVKKDWDPVNQHVINTDTIYGFHRVYNYSGSVSVNTKIYGMYQPMFMKKKQIQIRHIITPEVSVSATPDFGSSHYGYYDSYVRRDLNGTPRDTVVYSLYEGSLFGVPGRGKSGVVSFRLSNNLEMKYRDKNDSIKKVSLIDELGFGLSYNFAAQVRPWSDLSMNLRMRLTKNYTFSMSTSFATYAYEFDKNGNVVVGNRTEWSYGRFGRFQGYGTSFNYTLNNQTFQKLFSKKDRDGGKDDKKGNPDLPDSENDDSDLDDGVPHPKRKVQAATDNDGYQKANIQWSVNLSTGFNIREDRTKPINKRTMRYPYKISLNALNINGNLKLTNKWIINFNTGYDFETKKIVQTSFNISRDLHCFTMTAAISPFGQYKYYNFTIRATASILQDLKWDQRSNTQSNIRWY